MENLRRYIGYFLILALCVSINLIGAAISYQVGNPLFLDLAGTAAAYLIFGPVHGALVGLSTNAIGEFGFEFENYFLFGIVQVWSACVWGIAPRLLRGRLGTDFFAPTERQLETEEPIRQFSRSLHYGKLLFGMLWLSFLSCVVAGLVVGSLFYVHQDTLKCGLDTLSSTAKASRDLCEIALLASQNYIILEDNVTLSVALTAAFIRWPDHIIALAGAILIIQSVLPGRRYKMRGIFGKTIVVQRERAARIFTFSLYVFLVWRAFYVADNFRDSGNSGVLLDAGFIAAYAILMNILAFGNNFHFTSYVENHQRFHVYKSINKNLEKAVDDILKLAAIVAIVSFVWVRSHCGKVEALAKDSICHRTSDGSDLFTGPVGVIALVTGVRYLILASARAATKS